ncbi:hypothetical protein [Ralstonia pseudosolanacearum]
MKWTLTALLFLITSGCGGPDDSTTKRGASSEVLPVGTKTVAASGPVTEWSGEYLSRGDINLTGAPGGIDWDKSVTVSLADGIAFPFFLDRNKFKYWGPALQQNYAYSVIQFIQGSNTAQLKIIWSTFLPRNVIPEHFEANPDDGDSPSTAAIVTASQYDYDRVTADSSLSFRPSNFPNANTFTADFRLFPKSGGAIDVSDSFSWDSSSGSFVLSTGENSLRQALRDAGEYTNLDISLTSANGDHTGLFSTSIVYAGSSVAISVENLDSTPAVQYAGQSVVLVQKQGPFRALAVLDANATANVDGLPAGNYSVSVYSVSPGAPSPKDVSVAVDTSASVTLRDVRPQQQTATLRRQDSGSAAPACTTEQPNGGVMASLQYVANVPTNVPFPQISQCLVNLDFAPNVHDVRIVMGGSFVPTDARYRYMIGGGALSGEGSVQELLSENSTSNDRVLCYRFPEDGQTHHFQGQFFMDHGEFSTAMSIIIIPGCDLKPTNFIAFQKLPNGNYIFHPKNLAAGAAGNYISIPVDRNSTTSFKAEIEYIPADAQIQSIKLYLVDGSGTEREFSADLINQASAGNGKISFSSLKLPTMNRSAIQAGPVKIGVKLKGLVLKNGGWVSSQSQIAHMGVGDATVASFSPLWEADIADTSLTAMRFGPSSGPREPGGDAWATLGLAGIIKQRGYRFNDISAQHVEQLGTPPYRSILGHSGHSDGQQVDLRYRDGAGGFGDAMGGQSNGTVIFQRAQAAAAELAASQQGGASTALMIAWVQQNRTEMELAANDPATVKIYFGDSWMQRLLEEGKVPGGADLPGVGRWISKPPIARAIGGHLHHWHLSTRS